LLLNRGTIKVEVFPFKLQVDLGILNLFDNIGEFLRYRSEN